MTHLRFDGGEVGQSAVRVGLLRDSRLGTSASLRPRTPEKRPSPPLSQIPTVATDDLERRKFTSHRLKPVARTSVTTVFAPSAVTMPSGSNRTMLEVSSVTFGLLNAVK